MAAKEKAKKTQTNPKRSLGKKVAPMKKAIKKKLVKKRLAPKKKLAKTNAAPKKAEVKTAGELKEQVRGKSQSVDTVSFPLERLGVRAGEQSGDLQGLSNIQGADSESVDELLEQGNAFEAEVVKGVEDAEDSDEGEVRTHEVPQDDVPGEYQDKEE
ncbi:MAG TPA: hypothetical protein VG075_06560 [Candidatus Acidoferrum sp.]|jgi:hypothetical protein|nr:hypothetical protein [Candidatus Acidoferrum sp.]